MAPMKPTMHLTSDDIPLDQLELDKDVTLVVKGRVTSMSVATTGEFASPGNVTIEVDEVGMGKNPEKKATRGFAL